MKEGDGSWRLKFSSIYRWIPGARGVEEAGAATLHPLGSTHCIRVPTHRELTPETQFAAQNELTKEIAQLFESEISLEEQQRVEHRPTQN